MNWAINKLSLAVAATAATAAMAAQPAMAAEIKLADTTLTLGGYIKLDTLLSRFSDGEVGQGTSRDFYVPSTIPVSAGTGQSHTTLDAQAKETRVFIKTDTPIDGHKLGTTIEFDFISGQVNQLIAGAASGAGNEATTNAYNPALRRAFVTYDNWLFGQEWTNFQNLNALPETLDFVAFPSDGTVFARQPQVRYTQSGLSVALENPETTVQGVGNTDDNLLPDLTLRYAFKLGSADLQIAGLARELRIDNPAVVGPPAVAKRKDSTFAGGGSFSGKITLTPGDDIRFMVNGGDGIGRYLALGAVTDAVADDVNHTIKPVKLYNAYVAYRHVWSGAWRSTVTLSGLQADNDTALSGTAVTRKIYSGSANLLYSPVKPLTLGVEYRHAKRELENGSSGELDRLQFSAKFMF